jgi:hypothetical protein
MSSTIETDGPTLSINATRGALRMSPDGYSPDIIKLTLEAIERGDFGNGEAVQEVLRMLEQEGSLPVTDVLNTTDQPTQN